MFLDMKIDFQRAEDRLKMVEDHLFTYDHVKASAYTLDPAETDPTPEWSSFGPSVPNQIAVSIDLEAKYKPKDVVLILFPNGDKFVRFVNDRLHIRKRNQIDILMPSKMGALNFGIKDVKILNLTRLESKLNNL